MPITEPRPDTGEMLVIHRVFRRELVALPGLVRGAVGPERTLVVADHVELILTGLHVHHSGEDALIWPRLLEREALWTELIETMQAQHHEVATGVEGADRLLRDWRTSSAPADRDALARALDELAVTLFAHLDLEEQEVLPLIARSITAAEWADLGDHGQASMTPAQRPLLFGCLLEEASPAEAAALMASVPGPVRLYLRTIGARRYRRYIDRVRG